MDCCPVLVPPRCDGRPRDIGLTAVPGVERLRATVKAMVINPGAVVDVHAPVLDPPRSLPWTQYRGALTRSTARQESVVVAPAVPDRQAWLGVLINLSLIHI